MSIEIERLDHLVLTVRDLQTTCTFYERVLGMQPVAFANGRYALQCGQQKINLHLAGHEFEPKASLPTAGSADFCLITTQPLAQVIEHLNACNAEIIAGPVPRVGALGSMESVYLRDPDGNLVEVARYSAST